MRLLQTMDPDLLRRVAGWLWARALRTTLEDVAALYGAAAANVGIADTGDDLGHRPRHCMAVVVAGGMWLAPVLGLLADDVPVADLVTRAVGIRAAAATEEGPVAGVLRVLQAQVAAEHARRTIPVVVRHRTIAQLTVTFPASGLLPEEVAFRQSIAHSLVIAAGLALAVALGAAVLASRRLVAPVRRLTDATRRLAAGDRTSRVGEVRTSGELAELASSFDTMAGALEREDTLRRTLVADLAHELRTPVAVLQAQLEGIAAGVVALDGAAVESLSEEVAELSRLIEDLRILAEADAAGLRIRREPVDLAEVASRAAARLAPFFVERGVHLDLQLGATKVLGDTDRLEQVLLNLLSNAAKFSAPGSEVLLRVAVEQGEGRLVVADHGRGIPPDEHRRIFDRFYRGAAAGGTSGSGIGLAVVSLLVAAHGGRISLSSSVGDGSVFTVHLVAA
jgi:signal transduction histidine kinase